MPAGLRAIVLWCGVKGGNGKAAPDLTEVERFGRNAVRVRREAVDAGRAPLVNDGRAINADNSAKGIRRPDTPGVEMLVVCAASVAG